MSEMDYLKAEIKSCIISVKGGIPLSKINSEYKSLNGHDVPFGKFGFKSMNSFLNSIEGVTINNGVVTATSIHTKHLENLVKHQKSKKTKNKKKVPINNQPTNNQPKRTEHTTRQNNNNYYYNKRRDDQNNDNKNNYCSDFEDLYHSFDRFFPLNDSSDHLYELYRYEFKIEGYNVIGDDCMLDFAFRSFYKPGCFYKSYICRPNQTLDTALSAVRQNYTSNRYLICCGGTDVHTNISLSNLILKMQRLLLFLMLNQSEVIACTLPPSPINRFNHIILAFNNWLMSLTSIKVIDLYSLFVNSDKRVVNTFMFERYSVPIFDTFYYYWSMKAQNKIKQKLMRELQYY